MRKPQSILAQQSLLLHGEDVTAGSRSTMGFRQWVCSECGSVYDREGNAAISIARLEHKALDLRCPGSSTIQGGEASRDDRRVSG